jgi:hypothetical protein
MVFFLAFGLIGTGLPFVAQAQIRDKFQKKIKTPRNNTYSLPNKDKLLCRTGGEMRMAFYMLSPPLTQATIFFKHAAPPTRYTNIPILNPGECQWADGHPFAKGDPVTMAKLFYTTVTFQFRIRNSSSPNIRISPNTGGHPPQEEEVRKFMRTLLYGDEYFVANLNREPSRFLVPSIGSGPYEIDSLQDRP